MHFLQQCASTSRRLLPLTPLQSSSVHIKILWTTRFKLSCRGEFTRSPHTARTNISADWLQHVWSKQQRSSTTLISGSIGSTPTRKLTGDTSSTCSDASACSVTCYVAFARGDNRFDSDGQSVRANGTLFSLFGFLILDQNRTRASQTASCA